MCLADTSLVDYPVIVEEISVLYNIYVIWKIILFCHLT